MALSTAIKEIHEGLIDAELGGGIIKKRISRTGAGKRSSYRTLIATNKNEKWFFIYGFAKNECENISAKELTALKELADYLLNLSAKEIAEASVKNSIVEVKAHDK